jgi:hypothetical protein
VFCLIWEGTGLQIQTKQRRFVHESAYFLGKAKTTDSHMILELNYDPD